MTDLAERRRLAGLTQVQLAIEAGCSRSSIAILEAGYVPRHSDVLARVDSVLARTHHDEGPAGNRAFAQGGRDGAHGTG